MASKNRLFRKIYRKLFCKLVSTRASYIVSNDIYFVSYTAFGKNHYIDVFYSKESLAEFIEDWKNGK